MKPHTVRVVTKWFASVVILLGCACFLRAQTSSPRTPVVSAFSELVGGKWVTDGTWSSGYTFKQEHIYEWGLNGKLIKVRVYDIDAGKNGEVGLRNEGIRAWDEQAKQMRFWEFDTFGGITTGVCGVERGSLFYEYDYQVKGETKKLRNLWTRLSVDTYTLKVGVWENGGWQKILLETTFRRVPDRVARK